MLGKVLLMYSQRYLEGIFTGKMSYKDGKQG